MFDVENFIEGEENNVVISVPHKEVLKVRTRPTRFYTDKELMTEEIGRELAETTKSALIVNDKKVDVNNTFDFFTTDREIKNAYYEAIRKVKPKLVIDLHGAADEGFLYLGSNSSGVRYMREFYEKPLLEKVPRPEVDIEFRRKTGDVTSKGFIIKKMCNFLARAGFVVGVEMVFPGGEVIKETCGFTTDSIALELRNSIRVDDDARSKLVGALDKFIKWFRTGEDREEIGEVINHESEEIHNEDASRYIG